MAVVDAEGIVTKETKYGDTSRILTVITRNLGKISVLAGNVRRGKSGLLTATSLFSYSKFTLFKGGLSSLYKLNEGELIMSFSQIKESLEKTAFASYFCDVTNMVVQENSPDESQADLLLRSLYMLTKDDVSYEKIKAAFEFRTLTISGMMPNMKECGKCGKTDEISAISPYDGVVYCENCKRQFPTAFPLNNALLAAMAYICIAEDKKIFSFDMSEASLKYLSELGEKCVEIMFDKKFKTLEYLRKVTALG